MIERGVEEMIGRWAWLDLRIGMASGGGISVELIDQGVIKGYLRVWLQLSI